MRIRKISDNEVSVYLTTRELEDFDFRMEGGVPHEESLHDFLYNVMELVQSESFFEIESGLLPDEKEKPRVSEIWSVIL